MRRAILILLLLVSFLAAYSQKDTIYNADNFYQHLFDNINTAQLRSGFLLDKAFSFTNLRRFEGVVHDSSYINFMQFKLIYASLYNMHLQRHRPMPEHEVQMAYYHEKERSDTIFLAGLATTYHRLKSGMMEQGKVYMANQKLQLAQGLTTDDIFEEDRLIAIAPLKEKLCSTDKCNTYLLF